jgi:hypothetical protein
MHPLSFDFTAPLWLWTGKGAWHFVTLPVAAAQEIRFFTPTAKGFVPIAVSASIGKTTWKTSIFPDSKSGSFLLAVKAQIRKAEGLVVGQHVAVQIVVR